MADGKSNREIAARLVVSVRTVERHLTNLYVKAGVPRPGGGHRLRLPHRRRVRAVTGGHGAQRAGPRAPGGEQWGILSARERATRTGTPRASAGAPQGAVGRGGTIRPWRRTTRSGGQSLRVRHRAAVGDGPWAPRQRLLRRSEVASASLTQRSDGAGRGRRRRACSLRPDASVSGGAGEALAGSSPPYCATDAGGAPAPPP